MSGGFYTLGQIVGLADTLVVSCARCGREGRFRTARLIREHGAGVGIPRLLELLAADCPRMIADKVHDPCGVHCPELPRLFGDPGKKAGARTD
jgi:hypothetical protein